jgi:hypothetical protein
MAARVMQESSLYAEILVTCITSYGMGRCIVQMVQKSRHASNKNEYEEATFFFTNDVAFNLITFHV